MSCGVCWGVGLGCLNRWVHHNIVYVPYSKVHINGDSKEAQKKNFVGDFHLFTAAHQTIAPPTTGTCLCEPPAVPCSSTARAVYLSTRRPPQGHLGRLPCQSTQAHVAPPGVGRRHICRTLYTPLLRRICAPYRCARGARRPSPATPRETDQNAADRRG